MNAVRSIVRFKKGFILLLLCGINVVGYSQIIANKVDSVFKKNGMIKLTKTIQKGGWLEYQDSVDFKPREFFKKYKKEFGLKSDDQLYVYKNETDDYGWEHNRYKQLYKGLNVEFSEVAIHSKDGKISKSNGLPALDLNLSTTPIITKRKAIELALLHVHAKKYIWEGQKDFVDYPKPELVVLPKNDYLGIKKDYLAYKMDVYANEPLYRAWVYVDAHSGEVVFENSRINYTSYTTRVPTRYSGDRTINTEPIGNLRRLHDTERNIITKLVPDSATLSLAIDITNNNASNLWYGNNYTDAHWGTGVAYDYFYKHYGRKSYDNQNAVLYNYLGFGTRNGFAAWTGTHFLYGSGAGAPASILPTSLDMVGHEYTHAIISQTAGLVNIGESGTLNESLSDIFGILIEQDSVYRADYWMIGESVYNPSFYSILPSDNKLRTQYYRGVRDLCGPWGTGQPILYKGLLNVPDSHHKAYYDNDNLDVNIANVNSSIVGYWFYNLVNGTNNVNGYPVIGIGKQSAADIVYRMMTVYLTPLSKFAEARQASIEAASDLYGISSNQVVQVVNAWNAVGVYGPANVAPDITLNGVINDGSIHIASRDITAATTSSTTIAQDFTVIFRAGNSIVLKPGFHAYAGCTFKASVNTYNGTVLRSSRINTSEIVVSPNEENEGIDSEKLEMNIYPNPTNSITNVMINKPLDASCDLLIYNATGILVYKVSTKQNSIQIDLSGQAPGIYIVKVKMEKDVLIEKIKKD